MAVRCDPHNTRHVMFRVAVAVIILAGSMQSATGQPTPGTTWPPELVTIPERSDYKATALPEEINTWLQTLASKSDAIHVATIGHSIENRPIQCAIASRPLIRSPEERPANDPRLVVLLLGGIHAGECDGKEALLQILRELAVAPDHPWWQNFILLVVPDFNVDGAQRIGKAHRPGQNGPALCGRRENAQELDLNRDFVKLESPEVRALVGWAHRWDVDVFIDTHTTNGSRHRYPLLFDIPHNPAVPRSMVDWLRSELIPAVQERLERQGIATQYYGTFEENNTRWTTYGLEPRYSTEYFGLCGAVSVLSESYSYAPFGERIQVTRSFVHAVLDELSERIPKVHQLRREIKERAVQGGRNPAEASTLPIAGRLAPWPDRITIRAFDQSSEGLTPRDYSVEHWAMPVATREVPWPYAYLLSEESSRVADRLLMHGLRLEQLLEDATLEVEQYRLKQRRATSTAFQGHRLIQLEVEKYTVRRTVPAGTYVLRMDQARAALAVWLLEPESQDGLATWNFFDRVAARAGELFPVERLAKPTALRLRVVTAVEPAQQLDVDQLFAPDKQVVWEWPAPSGLRWLPSGDHYVRQYNRRTWRVDPASGAMSPLYDPDVVAKALARLPEIDPPTAQRLASQLGILSPQADAQILVFENDLYYCRLDGSDVRRLTYSPEPERLATFSPNGELVAFVLKHNLYVASVRDARTWALTEQGNDNHLFGELDWVYQEEVYGRGNYRGYWWSPDSQHIALLVLDETNVYRHQVVDHIPYRQRVETSHYPKAGDRLPKARLAIVRVSGGPLTWADLDRYAEEDRLLVRVSWHPSLRQVYLQVQDRRQTWLDLVEVSIVDGRARRLFRETSPAWIEPMTEPIWLSESSFLWLSPRTGYVHLYRGEIKRASATEEPTDHPAQQPSPEVSWTSLTDRAWEVRSLIGLDASGQWVYFTATNSETLEEHLYRLPLQGGAPEQITEAGASHSVEFNATRSYFFDTASSLALPRSLVVRNAAGQRTHVIAPTWDDQVRYYRLAEPKRIRFLARDAFPLDGYLLPAVQNDLSERKPIPLLCYVYGGPQAPVARNRWGATTYLWHRMLAQHGIGVWISDNRAATHRGLKHTWTIHRRLGEQELSDLEDGVAHLVQQGWVDPDRVGVWGWSYGGYFAAYALTHSKRFCLGIAGAPVTDWRNYDAIYTERLMGLPSDNVTGYRNSSVVEAARQLSGYLLLIHGDADDNVHLANTLQLVEALQKNGKRFGLMIYPRNRHAVLNREQRYHLWQLMTETVFTHLRGSSLPWDK